MIGKIFSSMSLTLSLLLGGGHAAAQLPVDPATLPRQIYSGEQGAFHVQGIAVDLERGHVWFSFTTSLLKTDMAGNLLASVEGMTGHLGCMSVNPEDGGYMPRSSTSTTLSARVSSTSWTAGRTTMRRDFTSPYSISTRSTA